jgi:hypothetical protein
VARKAVGGVVPTDALTTGAEDASAGWPRAFAKEVIADAHRRGLTKDRWPGGFVTLVGVGPFLVGGLLYLATALGGDASGDRAVPAIVAGAVAVASIVLLFAAAATFGRSLAQLPTPAGKEVAARCLGLRSHLREDQHLTELPPAAV